MFVELSDKANAIVTYHKTKNGFTNKSEAINNLIELGGMIE